jgi:hypothetical protein
MNRDQFEAKRRRYLAPDPAQPILTEQVPLPGGAQETQSLECVGQKEAGAATAAVASDATILFVSQHTHRH